MLKDLAAFVDEIRSPQVEDDFPRARANRNRPALLSMIQNRHWERTPNSRHTHAACWNIEGPLDIEILKSSLNAVVARHEILRTRFDIPSQSFKPIRRALGLKTRGSAAPIRFGPDRRANACHRSVWTKRRGNRASRS